MASLCRRGMLHLGSRTFCTKQLIFSQKTQKILPEKLCVKFSCAFGNFNCRNIVTTVQDSDGATMLTQNRQEKYQSIVTELLNKLGHNEELSLTLSRKGMALESQVDGIVLLLVKRKIAPRQIVAYIEKSPQTLVYTVESWDNALTSASDLGFDHAQLAPAVIQFPELLKGQTRKLSDTFEALRQIGVYESQIRRMLLSHPSLLDHDPLQLVSTFHQLLKQYPKTDLVKMVVKIPSILTTSPKDSLAKICYATDVMGVDVKYVASSDFLERDLLFIESRHQFLKRAGLYEKPDKHGSTKIENPTFRNIMDTEDRYFAKRVAGLSLAEYQMFVKLYAQEKDHMEDTYDEDSDSDWED